MSQETFPVIIAGSWLLNYYWSTPCGEDCVLSAVCPSCQTRLLLGTASQGKPVRCGKCGKTFLVPQEVTSTKSPEPFAAVPPPPPTSTPTQPPISALPSSAPLIRTHPTHPESLHRRARSRSVITQVLSLLIQIGLHFPRKSTKLIST